METSTDQTDQQKLKLEFDALLFFDAGGGGDCGPLSFRAGLKYIYLKNGYDTPNNVNKTFAADNIRKTVADEAIKKGNINVASKPREWWRTGIEFQTASNIYNVEIKVYSLIDDLVTCIIPENPQEKIRGTIYIIGDNTHFVIGLPKNEQDFIRQIFNMNERELIELSDMQSLENTHKNNMNEPKHNFINFVKNVIIHEKSTQFNDSVKKYLESSDEQDLLKEFLDKPTITHPTDINQQQNINNYYKEETVETTKQNIENKKGGFDRITAHKIREYARDRCCLCRINTLVNDCGTAAHIEAKGNNKDARYNENLAIDYIKSFENGIWLCHNCHDMIDKPPTSCNYSVDSLKKAKEDHRNLMEERLDDSFKHRLLDEVEMHITVKYISKIRKIFTIATINGDYTELKDIIHYNIMCKHNDIFVLREIINGFKVIATGKVDKKTLNIMRFVINQYISKSLYNEYYKLDEFRNTLTGIIRDIINTCVNILNYKEEDIYKDSIIICNIAMIILMKNIEYMDNKLIDSCINFYNMFYYSVLENNNKNVYNYFWLYLLRTFCDEKNIELKKEIDEKIKQEFKEDPNSFAFHA